MPPTAKPAGAPPAAAATGKATMPAAPKPAGAPTPPAPAKPAAAAAATARPAPQPPAAPVSKPAAEGNGAPPSPDKAAAPAAAPATVDFKCPQCDEAIKIDIALAGKMAPCPECRRIVRVPLPTKKQPTDWRNVPTGPSLARTDTEPVPDGAWGSASASTVSREAMREAEKATAREPWTRGQKIKYGAISAAVVALVVAIIMGVTSFSSGSLQDKALREAMRTIPADNALAAAEIHRAIGEYSLRAGGEAIPIGRQHLNIGIAKLTPATPDNERDVLLTDIALLQVELIPDDEQLKKAKIQQSARDEQDRAFLDLKRTLSLIVAPDARAMALRQVTQKLHGKSLAKRADFLARETDDGTEVAIVGLELWRLGQTQPATGIVDLLLKKYAPPAKDKEPKGKEAKKKGKTPPAALVALCVVLKKPQEEMDKLNTAFGDQFSWQLGQIHGLALLGEFEKARAEKANLQGLDQLYAFAALAAGDAKNPAATAALEEAAKWLADQDQEKLNAPAANRPDPSWTLLGLTQLAIAAGKPDLASAFAAAVPDTQLRGRAKLAILRDKLAKTSARADESLANDVEMKDSSGTTVHPPAQALAKEAIARHNVKVLGGSTVFKEIAGWPAQQPFGYVGVALGLQEK
jgi:hypothetical protein